MKKLFFSAVFLLAFSGVSIANTIEVKNLDEIETKSDEKLIRTTPEECASIRVLYYDHLISQGVPHSEASGRSYSIYFQCMGKVLSIE